MESLALNARQAALDFDGWLANQPDPMRQAIDHHLGGAIDREVEKKRLANSLWISERTGVSPYEVDRNYEMARAGFGERVQWGDDWKDDDRFHARIVAEATREADELRLIQGDDADESSTASSLVAMARQAAIDGKTWSEPLGQWAAANQKSNGYDGTRMGEYSRIAREAHAELAADAAAARPAAEAAWVAMRDEDDAAALAAFKPLTPQQRALAVSFIQKFGKEARKTEEGEGFREATEKTLARASDRLFLGSGRGARLSDLLTSRGRFTEGSQVQAGSRSAIEEIEGERIAMALARSSSGPGAGGAAFARAVGEKRALSAEEAARWNAEIDSAIDDAELTEELRAMAQSTVDPITGGSAVRRKVWQPAVESLPTMTALAIPGAWAPAVEMTARAYQGDEYSRLRGEGIERDEATKLAAISGSAQAAMDFAGVKFLQKFAPRSVRELMRFKVAPASAVARAGTRFALGAAGETAIEQIQDHIIPAAVDDFISNDPRLDRNWGEVWKDVAVTAPDVFLGMLLPTAFFAAAGARGDIRAANELMGANALGLRVAGYSPEAAAEIVAAKSPEAVRDLLNRHAPLDAPTPEQRAATVEQIVDEARAMQDEAAVEADRQRKLLEADNVSLTRRGGQWIVSDGTTEVAAENSAHAIELAAGMSEAVTDYDAAQLDQLVSNIEAVEALDASQPEGQRSETVLYPQKIVTALDKMTEGAATEEAILERMRIFEQQHGLAPGEGASAIVLGENAGEMRDGIFEDVSKINAGGTVLDVFEERIEGRMKAAFERGTMTRDEAAGVLAAVEAATGDRYVTGTTDTDLIEGVSSLLRAELFRRRKDDGSLAPRGLITKSLTAAARGQAGAARTGASKAISFIRAARAYLGQLVARAWRLKKARAEGKIGENVDQFLAKLAGVEEQAVHNKAVLDAAGVTVESLATSTVKAKRNVDLAGFKARVKAGAAAAGQPTFSIGRNPFEPDKAEATRFKLFVNQVMMGNPNTASAIHLGSPEWLTRLGYESKPIQFGKGIFYKVTTEKHHLTEKDLHRIPSELANPVAVFRSRRSQEAVMVLTDLNEPGKGPVVITIDIGSAQHKATSSYGKSVGMILEHVREGLLYVNKEKARQWGINHRVQFPQVAAKDRLKRSILTDSDIVKPDGGPTMSLGSGAVREETFAMDREYLAAVGRGDMGAAQRMVDEAAKAAGYTEKVFHGTSSQNGDPIKSFDPGKSWWTRDEKEAERFANATVPGWTPKVYPAFIKVGRTMEMSGPMALENFLAQPFLKEIIRSGKTPEGTPDTFTVKGRPWLVPLRANQIKSAAPVTRDETGNVIPLSQRFNPADDRITFSLGSAQMLENVANAMASRRLPPRRRLQGFEAAAEQLKGMARSMRFVDQVEGKPGPKRNMLRSLAAFDAILMQFPAEVRGKVGGFTKLAGLETNAARERYLKGRVEKLDKVLETYLRKEYTKELVKLFDRAKPRKGAPGEKPIGKLGADEHSLMDAAQKAMAVTETEVAGRLADLDTRIASGELTPEQESLAMRERELINLTGDWKNADAAKMAAAWEAVNDVYEGGFLEWSKKLAERREAREKARGQLMLDVGMLGTPKERQERAEKDLGWMGKTKEVFLSLSSFEEVTAYIFGRKSEVGQRLVESERAAAYQYEDAVQAMGERIQDLFTRLAGGSVLKGEKLRYRLSQPSVKTGNDWGTLSELQSIQALLMWAQEDGQRHMEAFQIDQGWIDGVAKQLSPEGQAVMAFIQDVYAAEHAGLNTLYRERHGVNLPRHDNYAPLTVKPLQARAGEVVDPVSGQAMAGSVLTPGSLRTRNRMATAEPDFRDALQTLLGHHKQMEHWKAYYDFAMEANSLFGNRNLGNSVKAKAGAEAEQVLRKWVDLFANGGHRDAAGVLALNQWMNRVGGRFARMALVGRVGTLVIQSTQMAAALAEMPAGAYVARFGKLMAGQLGWGEAIRSPFIQRRYQQAPPIVRQALDGLAVAAEPNAITHAAARLGQLISGADAIFTAGTYAILLDYHRTLGRQAGLTGAALESHARREAERLVERVAQPTRMGARSLYENTATHPLARLSWAFASEARQKIALAAWAARGGIKRTGSKTKLGKVASLATDARAARVAAVVWGAGGLMATIIRNAWRDMRDDEDDEWLDERNWGLARLTVGTLAGPLYGVPLIGEAIESTMGAALGAYVPTGGAMESLPRAVPAVKRLATLDFLDSDDSVDDLMRDVEAVMMAAGLFNETAASAAALMHPVRDAAAVVDNVISE